MNTTKTKADDLHDRLVMAEIAQPDHIRRDTTLDGRPSVFIDVDGDRWSHIRATLRRNVFEVVAGDDVIQSDLLFASDDVNKVFAFIAGWVAAQEE